MTNRQRQLSFFTLLHYLHEYLILIFYKIITYHQRNNEYNRFFEFINFGIIQKCPLLGEGVSKGGRLQIQKSRYLRFCSSANVLIDIRPWALFLHEHFCEIRTVGRLRIRGTFNIQALGRNIPQSQNTGKILYFACIFLAVLL